MKDILIQMQIENFNFNRVDLRFDFFNVDYDKLFNNLVRLPFRHSCIKYRLIFLQWTCLYS